MLLLALLAFVLGAIFGIDLGDNLGIIIALVLGIYEVIARLVPTVTNWSVLNFIIRLFSWISESLNVKKK